MSKNRNQNLVTPEIFHQAVIGSFTKLNPRYMMKNPVMFVVEVGCIITLLLSIFPGLFGDVSAGTNLRLYNVIVCIICSLLPCLRTSRNLWQKDEEKHRRPV